MNRSTFKHYGSKKDFKKIYLIAPKHPDNFWSMQGTADILGAKTLMPNSALATLMALTPKGVNIRYALADENVTAINFEFACDLVVITGGTLHSKRIHELCNEFRKRGKQTALGGHTPQLNMTDAKDWQIISLLEKLNTPGRFSSSNGQKVKLKKFTSRNTMLT